MAAPAHSYDLVSSADPTRDWRVGLGLASTALWLSLGLAYIARHVGWRGFLKQPVDAPATPKVSRDR